MSFSCRFLSLHNRAEVFQDLFAVNLDGDFWLVFSGDGLLSDAGIAHPGSDGGSQ